MDEEHPPRFLKTAEVADRFRVSRMTVTRWATDGLLPYSETPTGHRRFRADVVEEFLRERGNEPGAA